MKIWDLIGISLKNLRRSLVRTVLTVISMMVGAFLVAILMSAGKGLEKFMISQVTMFANDKTITVQKKQDLSSFGMGLGGGVTEYKEPTTPPASGSTGGQTDMEALLSGSKLHQADLDKVRAVEHVQNAEFENFMSPDFVRTADVNNKKLNLTLYSILYELRSQLTFSVVDQSLLTRDDSIVLSDNYAEAWGINKSDLIGKPVYIQVSRPNASVPGGVETKEFEFVVAGLTEKSLISQAGYISSFGHDELAAFKQNKELSAIQSDASGLSIVAVVDNTENAVAVDKAIGDLGYDSQTTDEAIGQIGTVFNVITYALGGFGIVALVVASIGIANILMMAVYERTREIGVMKAVGATRLSIGALFTVEAGLLGFLGGAFGLLIGWGFGSLVNSILHNGLKIGTFSLIPSVLADYPTFNVSVFSAQLVILVLAITTGVALVAGLYPAWRAGRLNAIEALRHD